MTFFFLVVGLEARREFDVGELRERRRLAAAGAGRAGRDDRPVGIYLAVNGGGGRGAAAGAWRCRPTPPSPWACSPWSAAVLPTGYAASCSPSRRRRLRRAARHRGRLQPASATLGPLLIAVGVFALVLLALRAAHRPGLVYFLLGRPPGWRCSSRGVDPVVLGLAVGLITWAYTAGARTTSSGRPTCSGVPRAADPRAGPLGEPGAAARRSRRTTACSSSTTRGRSYLDRAAVRPGQRRASRSTATSWRKRLHLPADARHRRRLRGRQAGRRSTGAAWLVTPGQPRPAPPPVGWAAVPERARSPGSASPSPC